MATSFFRYLDTNGDGTGAKEANVDGSVTPVEFSLSVPAGVGSMKLTRMIVYVRDTGSFDTGAYGNAIAMTNGMLIEHVDADGNVITDLLDGVPILTSGGWSRQCFDVVHSDWGSGDEFLAVRWTFEKAGAPLILNNNERLRLTIRDDLTNLVSHTFMIQGTM